jgi:hypothetical protein
VVGAMASIMTTTTVATDATANLAEIILVELTEALRTSCSVSFRSLHHLSALR